MNAHIEIELVKKWLADNESVSQQELKDNSYAANQHYNTASAAYVAAANTAAANAAYYVAYYGTYYATCAAYAATDDDADDAAYWVRRYEELIK